MAVLELSPQSRLRAANDAFLRHLGLSRQSALDRPAEAVLGAPLPGLELTSLIELAGAGREWVVELERTGQGGRGPLRLALSALDGAAGPDVEGAVCCLAILREAAADQALAREAEHRGMNALALVQSIVRLSAGRPESLRERVESLVRAHGLLADHRWRRAPILPLAQGELGQDLARVRLEGEALELDGRVVQPLAIILCELRLNARAHGALSAPEGRVNFAWRAAGGDLFLEWTEAGGPPPAPQPSPGVGAVILRALAERQLKGELDQKFPREGHACTLRLPGAVAASA